MTASIFIIAILLSFGTPSSYQSTMDTPIFYKKPATDASEKILDSFRYYIEQNNFTVSKDISFIEAYTADGSMTKIVVFDNVDAYVQYRLDKSWVEETNAYIHVHLFTVVAFLTFNILFMHHLIQWDKIYALKLNVRFVNLSKNMKFRLVKLK